MHFGGNVGWSGLGPRGGGGFQHLRGGLDGWDDEEFGSVFDYKVVRRLIGYLAPYKLRAFMAIVGMVFFIFTTRFQPIIIGQLVDSAAEGDIGGVNRTGAIFVVLAVGAGISYFMQLINTGWIGHRVLFTLRMQMFDHLQKLSLRPSEYVRRQVRVTPYPAEDTGWIIEQAGPEVCLFSSDYPHVEGGRNPLGRFERSTAHLDAEAKQRFYRRNFEDLMGAGLSGVAIP